MIEYISIYHPRAIISRGLYIFTPFFTAVNITDNLCAKQGNFSKKSAVYNQERVVMVCARYIYSMHAADSIPVC
jgi:hypothetical protein